ncbi:MAG: hypothetical protein Q8859_11870 [Bacteroidota bacterium]|nr:hypothetical protein [Bacteroidota bacterium]
MLPELDNMKQNNPFGVPEGYFENFSDRLEKRIRVEEEHKNVFRKIVVVLKPAIGLAASLLLVLFLVYSPFKRTSQNTAPEPRISASKGAEMIQADVENYSLMETPSDEVIASATHTETSNNKITTNNNITQNPEEVGAIVSDYDLVYAEQ